MRHIKRILPFFGMMLLFWSTIASAQKTALMIIDMQPDFLRYHHHIQAPLVNEQLETLDWAKENQVPVMIVNFTGYGTLIKVLHRKIEEFPRHQVFVVEKAKDGAFQDPKAATTIKAQLKKWQVNNLLVTGINASYCVQATIDGALKEGYQVCSAADLVADMLGIGSYPQSVHIEDPQFLFFDTRKNLQKCDLLLRGK